MQLGTIPCNGGKSASICPVTCDCGVDDRRTHVHGSEDRSCKRARRRSMCKLAVSRFFLASCVLQAPHWPPFVLPSLSLALRPFSA